MKRDRIIIFVLVGVMVFSAVAFSLPFLAQNGTDNNLADSTNQDVEGAADIINQAAELNDQIPKDRYLPDGDVTELATEDLSVGEGQAVTAEDTITVHYTGWLAADGSVFDSSHLRGEPATFPLSGVIAGWTEGIPGMQPGGKRRLVIPSELAYGSSGSADGSIPPNSDLVFEVELVSIE